jgi:carbon starvation protein CstA
VLFKMKRERFAWVALVPTTWLVICTVTAGLEKMVWGWAVQTARLMIGVPDYDTYVAHHGNARFDV